jgi:hypothetical protein
MMEMAGSLTPTALSSQESNQPGNNRSMNKTVACVVGWGTLTSRDYKDSGEAFEKNPDIVPIEGRLSRQVMPGPTTQSNTTTTGNTGVLDAAFSRWLQGYPEAWDRCSPGWKEWETWQEFLRNHSDSPNETESAD